MMWVVLLLFLKMTLTFGMEPYSCVHGGISYNHGEYFMSNESLLQAELPGGCIQCQCDQGFVLCEAEDCSKETCEGSLVLPGYCCRKCPDKIMLASERGDRREVLKQPTSIYFTQARHKRRKGKHECDSGGRYYPEGATWQPIMGPLGPMSCVKCSCQSENIVCSRITCKEPPCSRPQRLFGECCPVCPLKDNLFQGNRSCLPRSAEVLVFKTRNITKTTSKIQFGFLGKDTPYIQLQTWEVGPTIPALFQTKVNTKLEMVKKDLTLVGATSYRNVKRFAKSEERLKSKCYNNCLEKVLRLEKILKIYPAIKRSSCFHDEFTVEED